MDKDSRIYVAGHRGMAGSAVCRALQAQGFRRIVTRTHAELDLCRQGEVERFFAEERPEYVFHCAARVGGIAANAGWLSAASTLGAIESAAEEANMREVRALTSMLALDTPW